VATLLRFLILTAALLCGTHAHAQGATEPDGPVPVGTPEWSSRLIMYGRGAYIPEAATNLLARYLSARGIGTNPKNWLRDQRLLTELLFAYDVNAYQQSNANEILRPQLLRAVKSRMDGIEPQRRLRLRMNVELGQYDGASKSFELLYPLSFDSDPKQMLRGSATGVTGVCVWAQGRKLRPDTGSGFFIVLPLCREEVHRWIAAYAGSLALGEAPAAFVLRVAPGTLWSQLPVAEDRASSFLAKHKEWRGVLAELVFDLESFTPLHFGPFKPFDPTVDTWAAEGWIKPVALFVWEQVGSRTDFVWQRSDANGWRFLGALGATTSDIEPGDVILTHAAVSAPLPTGPLADHAPTTDRARRAPTEAGKKRIGATMPSAAAPKGGRGEPTAKKPTLPPVPVGK